MGAEVTGVFTGLNKKKEIVNKGNNNLKLKEEWERTLVRTW